MRFSSQNELTRYGKAELMALKETSSAKSPPMCQLDQRIARLNILNEKKDEIYEKQQQHEQHFRNLMPNFTNNWDRNNNFLALLNNYHGSLPASLPCPQGERQNAITLTMTFIIQNIPLFTLNRFQQFSHEFQPKLQQSVLQLQNVFRKSRPSVRSQVRQYQIAYEASSKIHMLV